MRISIFLFTASLSLSPSLRAQNATPLPGLADTAPPAAAEQPPRPPDPAALRKKASAGDAAAQFQLADLIMSGALPGAKKEEATELMEKAADAAHPPAMIALARLLGTGGAGRKADPERAKFLVQQAAEAGYAPAQTAHASLLFGQIDPKGRNLDYSEPLAWFQKAAAQGDMEAICRLGMMQAAGQGMPPDAASGWKQIQKAAKAGNPMALNEAALCLQTGRGVEQDPIAAIGYLQAASDLGNLVASLNLAECCLSGTGVPLNPDRAGSILAAAARQNHGPSQLRLGVMFEKGVGTQPNPVNAGINYLLAEANGVPEGRVRYDALSKSLSAKQTGEIKAAVAKVLGKPPNE